MNFNLSKCPSRLALLVASTAALLLVAGCSDEEDYSDLSYIEKYTKDGWIPLFNGKNLDGWTVKFRNHEVGDNVLDTFRVENGMLTASYDNWEKFGDEPYGHIFTNASYSGYKIRVEYRFVGEQVSVPPKLDWAFRNNGVMVHSQSPQSMGKDQRWPLSGEAQLLGGEVTPQTSSLKDKALAIFGYRGRNTANSCSNSTNIVKDGTAITRNCNNSSSPFLTGDQWVTFEGIVSKDGSIKHIINDKIVFEYAELQVDPKDKWGKLWLDNGGPLKLTSGHIGLQAETHPTQFRYIGIKPLDD